MADAKWYVVHTYSGYENMVASTIEKAVENRGMQDYVLEVQVPMEEVTEIKDGKTKEVERKLYPGYVLIKMVMTDESWYIVRNTRGVTGFVGSDSKQPIPLSEEEVAGLGVDTREVVVNFKEGDSVRITHGYLDGFIGVVETLDKDKGKVNVTVSMMGKDVPVELDLDQVDVIN